MPALPIALTWVWIRLADRCTRLIGDCLMSTCPLWPGRWPGWKWSYIIFKEQHNWNRIYCFSSKTVHIVVYCTNIYAFITPIDRLNILIGDWCNNYFAQIFVDGRKNYFTPGAFNKSNSSSSAKQPCGETNIFEATPWRNVHKLIFCQQNQPW